jgi:hypothetical protein
VRVRSRSWCSSVGARRQRRERVAASRPTVLVLAV